MKTSEIAGVPDFWDATEELHHLRQFAHCRRVAPFALLNAAITYRLAEVPPNVVGPELVGDVASLNFFGGLVADSGGGKTATKNAGRALLNSQVFTMEPGSGESLAHGFVSRDRQGNIGWHRWNILAYWDEITTLSGASSRSGSTLLSKLCTGWFGGEIGSTHADKAKSLPVGDHRYRLCVLAGIQPSRAHILLGAKDLGLPQRFVWAPATDPDMPSARPPDPGPLDLASASAGWETAVEVDGAPIRIDVVADARAAVDEQQLAKARGQLDIDPLDAHALLARLKVAAGLSLLRAQTGIPVVDEEAWQLSEVVMRVSSAVRDTMRDRLASDRREASRELGELDAERESAKAAKLTDDSRRVRWVITQLTAEPLTAGELKRRAASRDRDFIPAAISAASDSGRIRSEDGRLIAADRIVGSDW